MVEDLVADDATHFEALLARDRVDDHVAVDADEVLAVEDGVFVLARRIYNLGREVGVLVSDHFAKGVLDRRVVGVYEVAVDVLDCQGALACLVLAVRIVQCLLY